MERVERGSRGFRGAQRSGEEWRGVERVERRGEAWIWVGMTPRGNEADWGGDRLGSPLGCGLYSDLYDHRLPCPAKGCREALPKGQRRPRMYESEGAPRSASSDSACLGGVGGDGAGWHGVRKGSVSETDGRESGRDTRASTRDGKASGRDGGGVWKGWCACWPECN